MFYLTTLNPARYLNEDALILAKEVINVQVINAFDA